MIYSIYIGNAEIEAIEDFDNKGTLYHRVIVHSMNLPDAPTFPGDGMTGNSNGRHPGYSQWSEFCRMAGLYNLFFDKEKGLMSSHPGTMALRQEHARAIEQALAKWRKEHPHAKPGFDDIHGEYEDGLYDGILARLIWLDWWVKWALENCERPAIWNC